MGENMGGGRRDDVGGKRVSPHYHKTDCGNERKEGWRRGMGAGLGVCGVGGYRALDDKRVHEEVEGKIVDYLSGSPI